MMNYKNNLLEFDLNSIFNSKLNFHKTSPFSIQSIKLNSSRSSKSMMRMNIKLKYFSVQNQTQFDDIMRSISIFINLTHFLANLFFIS